MPTIIEERKRAPRLIMSLSVAVLEGMAHYVEDTENVSSTGLCLVPKMVFPVGSHLHLVFGRPPELPAITAEGIVRWSEGEKGVGVEFISMSEDDHQALVRFVNLQSSREQA